MNADAAKVAVCECLIAINADVDPVSREKWGPIVPPTAIDWIGNRLVSALADAGLLVTDADRAVLDAADWLLHNLGRTARPATEDEELNDAEQTEQAFASMLLAGVDKQFPAVRARREAQS